MRSIIILVLLAFIACAMCEDTFMLKPMDSCEAHAACDSDNDISIPVGHKAACTIGWCIDMCLSIMSPPFSAQCSGNYCICRKL
ncbi:unnamed protein product [Chironomus riparius]|uniref:Uncharacterized protein n=1 Tax=Chironomus riparius TaxID=315576 RepID=A0A9P0NI12_9DIPT|nr:unnamed protein product [Chironomus riparius]